MSIDFNKITYEISTTPSEREEDDKFTISARAKERGVKVEEISTKAKIDIIYLHQ